MPARRSKAEHVKQLAEHADTRSSKKIILCADGTWNEPVTRTGEQLDPKSTNVYKMSRALVNDTPSGHDDMSLPSDRSAQWIFYDQGVGTEKFNKIRGGLFGRGLSKNIVELYSRLAQSYRPGDEIYCFGFSRGAYTVRSLLGLIHRCGIIEKYDEARAAEALKLYRTRGDWLNGREKIAAFKQRYSWDARVTFIGVWDTVGALGIPVGRLRRLTLGRTQFHDVKLGSEVKHAYHAVSIDEKRESFRPALWDTSECTKSQSVEQVWFSGVHANIGGGYPDTGLSDIALEWMVEKAQRAGLSFHDDWRRLVSLNPNYRGELVESRTHFWGALPTHERLIRTDEPIHSSVIRRLEVDSTYDPANIRAYLRAQERLGSTSGEVELQPVPV